ncbi:DUF1242-domain-containing protein [Coniochaeta sp. PMI_546]|nr:DUF1242-domain-containing protein [Coniochaeta sp. PMI_546]
MGDPSPWFGLGTSKLFCFDHLSQPSALFNFQSLLLVILLLICTSAYVHQMFPAILDRNKNGFMGIFWKCARIGERLSPYISLCCVFMAISLFIGN